MTYGEKELLEDLADAGHTARAARLALEVLEGRRRRLIDAALAQGIKPSLVAKVALVSRQAVHQHKNPAT